MFTSTSRSRRHRNSHQNDAQEQQQPFFTKAAPGKVQAKTGQPFFQTKLTVGQPGDKYEKEADAVADRVVNGSGSKPAVQRQAISSVQRLSTPEEEKMPGTNDARMEEDKAVQEKPEVQRMDAAPEEEEPVQMAAEEEEEPVQMAAEEEEEPVQMAAEEEEKPVQMAAEEEEKPVQMAAEEEEEPVQMAAEEEEETVQMAAEEEEEPVQMAAEEEEEPVQAKSKSGNTARTNPKLGNRIESSKGSGKPLPGKTRAEMENAFGVSFAGVNVHTDREATEMNQELGAQAFTHGQDLYFNSGKYRPETGEGKRLLAHELTHVVQQEGGTNAKVQKQDTPVMARANSVKSLHLKPGKTYAVKNTDLVGNVWDNISANTGILPQYLKIFNLVFKDLKAILSFDWLPDLKEGSLIYVPSGDELALYQYYVKNGFDSKKAEQEFGQTYYPSPQREVMNSAVERTTSKSGEQYGTADSTFYTPNKSLAGATSKKTDMVDGAVEYKVNWGSDLWKCNIFVQDVMLQANYVPEMLSNKHYTTAGKLHESDKVTQIEVSGVLPGTIVQYFGGGGSNASHNMIITSFIQKTLNPDGTETWEFTAIGASHERAKEDERKFIVKPVYNNGYEIINDANGWTKIRFFTPSKKQETEQ